MSSPNAFPAAFALSGGGPALALYQGNYFSGSVRFVSSTHVAASDANGGTEPELPKATWTSAYTASAAGDVIIVAASHTETISSANVMATADVLTIGLGTGTSKPRFTSAVAGVMWTLNAAGLHFANLYFPASTAATTSRVTMSSTEGRLYLCDFECGANDTTTTVAVGGNNSMLASLTFLANASRPGKAIRVTGAVTGLRALDISLNGGSYGWVGAAFSIEAAVTRAYFENVQLANSSDFVATTTAATYKLLGVRPVDSTGCRVVIAA